MKKYRYDFSQGINVVSDKALVEGAVTVADNVDLRSGSPRPIGQPTFERSASSNTVSLFRYRGRNYESSEFRSYATGRVANRDVVYFARDGKYPAKFVEGTEVPIGTKAPSLAPTVNSTGKASSTVTIKEATGGVFKKDSTRSYRIGVKTASGVLPPGPRATIRFAADNAAASLTWTQNTNATSYLVFGGEEGQERLVQEVSNTLSVFTDTGATNAYGELASSYDALSPYTYAYTFFRNVKGVENESGPSNLSAQASPSYSREIKFDILGDGFFDQAGKVEYTTGITLTATDDYMPKRDVTGWYADPNNGRIKFTTLQPHGFDDKAKTRFSGFLDANWNDVEVNVSTDLLDDKVFYVKNRQLPTDPLPTVTMYGKLLTPLGGNTYGFDDGNGGTATSITGDPQLVISGGYENETVLLDSPHTNEFPWSEPTIDRFTTNTGFVNGTALGSNGIRMSALVTGLATLEFTPLLNQPYYMSCIMALGGSSEDAPPTYGVQFILGGDAFDATEYTPLGGNVFRVGALITKTANTSNQSGVSMTIANQDRSTTLTRFRIQKNNNFGRYAATNGSPVTVTDYSLVNAVVTLTAPLGLSAPNGIRASEYSTFKPGHYAQRVSTLVTINPAPEVTPSTDDAVWAVINGAGALYRAKSISSQTFELQVYTRQGSTCTFMKFVKDNGFLTHRYLYRTGDTSGWNLVEKIPIWTSSYIDFKAYNYLGDVPDSWYKENGVDVIFSVPSNGMGYLTSHGGILFGIEGNKVRWTPEDRPDAWPENFFYSFEGKPIALASYGQALIVLCDDAIYRIDGVVPTALTRTGTRAQDGCIAPYSVQRTSAGLLYLSRRGVMAFDGMDARCITDTRIPGAAFYAPGNLDVVSNNFYPTKYTQAYQALSGTRIGDDWSVHRLAFNNVVPGGYITSMRSFCVDGKYYLYTSAADADRDANTAWVIDYEAQGAPITTLAIKPFDVFVDADETTYMVLGNAGNPEIVSQNFDAVTSCQLKFWDNFAPSQTNGRAIYKLNVKYGQSNLPWFIRTGSNTCGDPFERKRFRSVELHTSNGATGAVSFRVWIDGNYICDGQAVASEGSTQPRKINLPVGRQLGYSIDVEIAGLDSIRGLEINYDATSQPSR